MSNEVNPIVLVVLVALVAIVGMFAALFVANSGLAPARTYASTQIDSGASPDANTAGAAIGLGCGKSEGQQDCLYHYGCFWNVDNNFCAAISKAAYCQKTSAGVKGILNSGSDKGIRTTYSNYCDGTNLYKFSCSGKYAIVVPTDCNANNDGSTCQVVNNVAKCVASVTPPTQTGTLKVSAKDKAGAIHNLDTVYVDGQDDQTNVATPVKYDNLAAGTYGVTIEKKGYLPSSESATVTGGETTDFKVTMTKTCIKDYTTMTTTGWDHDKVITKTDKCSGNHAIVYGCLTGDKDHKIAQQSDTNCVTSGMTCSDGACVYE